MKKGDRIGYEMWKVAVLPSITKDIENSTSAEILNCLIQENVEENFAITINHEFEEKFFKTSENIKKYIETNYGDFSRIDEDYDRYKNEVFEEVKPVKPFIDWISNQLSIFVQIINSGQEEKDRRYLAISFPNEGSKQLMLSRLKGRKNFSQGPFMGKDCPALDEKNPTMLKFLGLYTDEKLTVSFPNLDMGPALFNTLPRLKTLLEISDSELPVIKPLENNIGIIPCPEYLLEYTQLLLVAQFPETLNPGTMYIRIEGYFEIIYLRSRVVSKPTAIESRQKQQFKAALATDEIKINFEHFKGDYQLNIAQNKSVFDLVKSFFPSPAAFTTKVRLKPLKTFYGDNFVPQGQAMSLAVVESGVRLEEQKSFARKVEGALNFLVCEIKTRAGTEVLIRQHQNEKENLEKQLIALDPGYFSPKSKNKTAANSGSCLFGFCFTSKKKAATENKDEKILSKVEEEVVKKILVLESRYKIVCMKLEQLNKDLIDQNEKTEKAQDEYISFMEQQSLLRTQPRSSSSHSIDSPSMTIEPAPPTNTLFST